MTMDRIPVREKVHADLFAPPHVGDKLVDLVLGKWQPDTAQQEQLITHLLACHLCRATFIVLLSDEKDAAHLPSSTNIIHTLFARFVDVHHMAVLQEDEQMAAYAETMHRQGRTVADKQFPELANHIEQCPSYQAALDDILTILREDEASDMW